MKKTTIYLPEELASSVKVAARQTAQSEASLIREAISAYVATVERKMPRTIGIIADGSFDARDTEEWLLENWRPDW